MGGEDQRPSAGSRWMEASLGLWDLLEGPGFIWGVQEVWLKTSCLCRFQITQEAPAFFCAKWEMGRGVVGKLAGSDPNWPWPARSDPFLIIDRLANESGLLLISVPHHQWNNSYAIQGQNFLFPALGYVLNFSVVIINLAEWCPLFMAPFLSQGRWMK